MNTKCLAFDFVYSDTITLGPGVQEPSSFFQDGPSLSSERITDEGEQKLVHWILCNVNRRQLLLSKICTNPGHHLDSILDKEFPRSAIPRGGDIDFIVLDGNNPTQGVCIEFKKVKVRIDSNGEERVNGLNELEKLIAQGNARQSQGFWKSYICAVAVVDSHQHKTPNVFLRRGERQEFKRFYDLANMSGLHPDVGILLMEVSQPTGKSFNAMFGFGICEVRPAGILAQPIRLTEELQALFRKSMEGPA